jgi:hypothetical protein
VIDAELTSPAPVEEVARGLSAAELAPPIDEPLEELAEPITPPGVIPGTESPEISDQDPLVHASQWT